MSEIDKLKTIMEQNHYQYDYTMGSLAKQIIENQVLDDEEVLWVLFAYALKYEFFNDINAQRYSLLQLENFKNKHSLTLPDDFESVYQEKIEFLREIKKRLFTQLFVIEIVMLLSLVIIFAFILKYDIIFILSITAILTIANIFLTYRRVWKTFMNAQMMKLESYIEDRQFLEFTKKQSRTSK